MELVAFLCWQGFAPLELAAAPLEVCNHPTCPFRYVGGGISSLGVVSTDQLVSVSFSDRRGRIWSIYREDGAPWRAALNFWSPWSTLSSGVTDGCVMWWCLNSVVSEIIIDLVSFGITRWRR